MIFLARAFIYRLILNIGIVNYYININLKSDQLRMGFEYDPHDC